MVDENVSLKEVDLQLDNILQWGLHDLKGKGLKTTISKVVFAATIYHLWIQRNGRIYDSGILSEECVIIAVGDDMKLMIGDRKGSRLTRERCECASRSYRQGRKQERKIGFDLFCLKILQPNHNKNVRCLQRLAKIDVPLFFLGRFNIYP